MSRAAVVIVLFLIGFIALIGVGIGIIQKFGADELAFDDDWAAEFDDDND